MEGLSSHTNKMLLQHVSAQTGHYQVILEKICKNGDGLHINYSASSTYVCFVTSWVAQVMCAQPQTAEWLVNNKLQRVWKQTVVDYLQLLSQHFPGGTEGSHEQISIRITGASTHMPIQDRILMIWAHSQDYVMWRSKYDSYYFFIIIIHSGVRLSLLVLRSLLAYCTSPRW
jgi:hypothetical protein